MRRLSQDRKRFKVHFLICAKAATLQPEPVAGIVPAGISTEVW
jgi:hypothetical protein